MKFRARGRPSSRFFIFVIITILCVVSILGGKGETASPEAYLVYRIRFEYFGMDAPEMEKLIAIPLEEGISAMGNIAEIRTVCDYALVETTVFFNRDSARGLGGILGGGDSEKKKIYLALRDTVDSLYRGLPRAVQKPRIYESGGGRRPFFSAAVLAKEGQSLDSLRTFLEHNLKRELENLDGIGEVTVTGASLTEVHIEFDPDRGALTGLDPAALGSIVQDANVLGPGGIFYGEESDTPLRFNTRIGSLEEIKGLPVKAGEEISALAYFAEIGTAPREQREIVTLNGKECAGLSITAVPGANLITLSRQCRDILRTAGPRPESLQILHDEGEVLGAMIRGMIFALIQSFAAVMIIIPFFFKSPRTILLIVIFLPVNVLWSLAFLRILGLGLDQYLLSGLSISLGLVIDPLLIIACKVEKTSSLSRGIAASVFTTLLVIFPLCFLDSIAPGIRRTALAIIAMTANSLILGLIFFPGFLRAIGGPVPYPSLSLGETAGEETTPRRERGILPASVFRRVHRASVRLGYLASSFAGRHRRGALVVYGALGFLAFLVFFVSGKNLNLEFRLPLLYASVEFESDKSAAAVHRDLEELGRRIQGEGGVRFVWLECRNGTGEFEIGFNEGKIRRRDLAERISSLAPLAGEGFLYVPDADAGFRSAIYEVEVTAVSADGEQSRELAKEGARIAGKLKGTVQTVLNFKEPASLIALRPDREILAKSSLSVRELGSSLRWLLFGPVIGKWVQDGREIDIRVMGRDLAKGSRIDLGNLALPSPSGPLRLKTLGSLEEQPGDGTVYRQDGRRVSYFTVHISAKSAAGAAELLRENLNRDRDRGSGFLLSRELELLNSRYFLIFLVFMGSFAGIFLILLGITERWQSAARISSIIPVSCALPLLVKLLCRSPLEMGDAVALVVVAGLSVNNGVFIEESRFSAIQLKIRDKILSILVTSLTGITGAIPLALLGGEGFSAALSRGILWGIAGSLLASLFLFPALYPKPAPPPTSRGPSTRSLVPKAP
jgi:HAE1 family hydrophobic/amphiphilic exporter-1